MYIYIGKQTARLKYTILGFHLFHLLRRMLHLTKIQTIFSPLLGIALQLVISSAISIWKNGNHLTITLTVNQLFCK